MTDERSAMDVEAVLRRFNEAGSLLTEAAARTQQLGDAAEVATRSSTSLDAAAQGLSAAAEQLQQLVGEISAAHGALIEAMEVAQSFLASTDVSAVAEGLRSLDTRLQKVETQQSTQGSRLAKTAAEHTRGLEAIAAQVDRSEELLRERNEATQRLAEVMRQIPSRAAKKIV